jgi:serine/threonine protein kinase
MAEDRKRAQRIVAAALRLDPAARAVWLDEACGNDQPLRAWVEALIHAWEQTRIQAAADLTTSAAGRGAAAAPRAPHAFPSGSASNGEALPAHAPDSLAERLHPRFPFLAPPTRAGSLGRLREYEVLELLGEGAFSLVFKALDEELHRIVALKVLSPRLVGNVAARRRWREEARAAAAVLHENVVAIHAVAEEPIPYLVMEYVPGPSLEQKLATTGPLELKQILRIGQQVAAGLAAAYRQGLLHGAIKPSNILLENGLERVKITDFGLAAVADDEEGSWPAFTGSPMYMAPEQALDDAIDHRADLFSLGSVLYQMCTGRPPFGETGSLTILKHVVEDQPRDIRELNRDIPPWLCGIIAKLHAKSPGERYQSAEDVDDLLSHCLAELHLRGEVSMPSVESPVSAPPRRLFWRAIVGVLGLLILFGDLLVAYYFDLPPFTPREPTLDENLSIPVPEGVLSVAVMGEGLRLTVRRVGPEPITYADKIAAKSEVFTVQPGRIWVQATRNDVAVFEEFVEIAGNETKTVTIKP